VQHSDGHARRHQPEGGERQGTLVRFNVTDHLVELFNLTRLDTLIDIRPNRPGKIAPSGAFASPSVPA
jgi:hypothetical protein